MIAFADIDPNDLGPTVRVVQEAATSHHRRGLSSCQYLWADARSAQLFRRLRDVCTTTNDTDSAAAGMALFRQQVRRHLLDPGVAMDPYACLQALTDDDVVACTATDLLQVYNLSEEQLCSTRTRKASAKAEE